MGEKKISKEKLHKIGNLRDRAINRGLSELFNQNPDDIRKYRKNLDYELIDREVTKLFYGLDKSQNLSPEKKADVFEQNIKNFVLNGGAFKPSFRKYFRKGNENYSGIEENSDYSEIKKEKSKNEVGNLDRGLEKKVEERKGPFKRFRNKRDAKYVIDSDLVGELRPIADSYDKKRGAVYHSVLDDMQAAYLQRATAEILRKKDFIGDVKYFSKKLETGKKIREGINFLYNFDKYTSQKVAASFLGFLGAGMILLSKKTVTGAVVGSISVSHYGILGGSFILIALLFFLLGNKKKKF